MVSCVKNISTKIIKSDNISLSFDQ